MKRRITMAPRRSLGNALELTADKLAFIQQGSPAENRERGDEGNGRAQVDEGNSTRREALPTGILDRGTTAAVETFRPPYQDSRPSLIGEVLVPVTTRVRPETANALRRAYLEQKLAQRTPATQQEIIEEALTAWLRQHRFLA
jgi:hypothetical protein